jgi:RND family efflux transporter MFP subunit
MNLKSIISMAVFTMLVACSPSGSEQAIEKHQVSFESAAFHPQQQFKTHQLSAFVEPTNQAYLSFQISGIIAEQYIKIGDFVEVGEDLFKVSNPSLQPQIQQYKSQIDAIQANLIQNQAEVKRLKNLKKTNAVSQNDLDKLVNQRDNLLATQKSVEAQLEQAQSMFNESILKAPFAGTIAEIYKESGEVIQPGEVILLVGGVASLEAPIYLPAFLHKNIALGQSLTALYADKALNVTVKEISMSANPKSQLFKVMLDVPIEHEIKSGEKITITIKEPLGEYYQLPIESVIDDGINEPFVFVIDNNKAIHAPISLIDISNEHAIVKMPQQGEIEVVISGQVNLSPQQNIHQP